MVGEFLKCKRHMGLPHMCGSIVEGPAIPFFHSIPSRASRLLRELLRNGGAETSRVFGALTLIRLERISLSFGAGRNVHPPATMH